MKKFKTINQFTPSVAFGDSVSNALLYAQRLLIRMGYESKIYIGNKKVDLNFKNEVYHISEYEDDDEKLLLYHYSIGHEDHDKIVALKSQKVLVFHNITPSHYFKNDEKLFSLCELGRKQLSQSSNYFSESIADSNYNAKELKYYGFNNTKILPILIDFDKKRKEILNEKLIQKYSNTYNILFVGRVVPHKAQLHLVDTVFYLKKLGMKNFIFHIVGGVGDIEYMQMLKEYVDNLKLNKYINFTNKVSGEDLATYYKISNLYLSVSNHEGFGMPLIEAMQYNTPVLAYSVGGVTTTVPPICLLEKKSPSFLANTIISLRKNKELQTAMISEQQKHLQKFSCENIYNQFKNFLESLEEKRD